MSLPKLNERHYETEIPSLGEKLKYRPFLVKEQKLLMLASEANDERQTMNAIADLIKTCTDIKYEPSALPVFDIEYIFLQLRSKSIGTNVTLTLTCPDDNETKVNQTISLDDAKVVLVDDHTNRIELNETVGMEMNYPTMGDMLTMDTKNNSEVDNTFSMIISCIDSIYDGEQIYSAKDLSESELSDFLDQMSFDQLQMVKKFFETMPKVILETEVTNPNTGVVSTIKLEGINNFLE